MTHELLDACLDELSEAAQVRASTSPGLLGHALNCIADSRYPQALNTLDMGLDFSWPKMHMALNHTVPRLRAKGPANNYHTGLGEGLHPQMKKDFRVSNKQPGYEKQVGSDLCRPFPEKAER